MTDMFRRPARHRLFGRIGGAAAALALLVAGQAADAAEVNLYSARQEQLIRPILDTFTAETGIKVNLLSDSGEKLLARIQAEGENSPADILLTVDVARLEQAKEAGIFQPVSSKVLEEAVPAYLRDRDDAWFGLSKRARVVVYAKDRVKPEELSTYEQLADPVWKGRIAIRSSSNTYNQSMTAAMIVANGPEKTEEWAKGLVANFARKPQGGDRDQIQAVASGEADIAVVNTYYLGGMLAGNDQAQKEAAQKVAVFFPNQGDRGTHVNVSGAGVVKTAPNRDAAVKLLEFLVSEKAQKFYAEVNQEFPVRPGVPSSAIIQSWGPFKEDTVAITRLGELNRQSVEIMDRAGWR
ncbi:Fe(3+) ABC transporter substrate-binding protein [Tistrella mobilis]|uniref:Fe(3+) ABC transporter substrate-binding protein n=1 Tax=Tistrella mobilis TaxID=171437 RepID=UPI003557305A